MTDYKLRRPCPKCPFRTDIPGYLRPERAQEIARSLLQGAEFPCHETTTYVEYDDDDDEMVAGEGAQFCAGALIMLERQETPNQMMRIAERQGHYDASKLDMSAPVVASTLEFCRHHDEEEEDTREVCSVVNSSCEAPAGYLVDGGVIEGEGEAEFVCSQCWEPVCGACSVEVTPDERVCDTCVEDNEAE